MITICWDVDDVLNNLMEAWFCFFKLDSNKDINIDYNDIIKNPPDELLGITKKEYLDSLDYFRVNYYSLLPPNKLNLKLV